MHLTKSMKCSMHGYEEQTVSGSEQIFFIPMIAPNILMSSIYWAVMSVLSSDGHFFAIWEIF